MNETKKANLRRVNNPLFQEVFVGDGIDIGSGSDGLAPCAEFPLIKSVKHFDKHNGNAQHILEYEKPGSYDFVYSSHCLEHLLDPELALIGWGALVRPGGHMIIVVPHEDLYEQGIWPSKNNRDHKFSFAINKIKSWSPVSMNLLSLVEHRLGASWKILKMGVESTGYDFKLQGSGIDQTCTGAEANIEVVLECLI